MFRNLTWPFIVGSALLLTTSASAQSAAFPPPPSAAEPVEPAPPTPAASQQPPSPYPLYPPDPYSPQSAYSPQPPAPRNAPQTYASPTPAVTTTPAAAPLSPASFGYRLETQRNTGVSVAGALTLGIGYLGGLGYLASADVGKGGGWLAVPVLGPWAAISVRDFGCRKGEQPSQDEINACISAALRELKTVSVLSFSGMIQVVGATLLIVGITDTDQQWVPASLPGMQIDVGPVGHGGQGLLVRGQF